MEREALDKAETFKKHIGMVIRKYRKYRGIKQSDLAGRLGVKESTVSRYENGDSEIKASTMAHISQICDFDLIEYIPLEDVSLSQRFNALVQMSGIDPFLSRVEPSPVQDVVPRTFRDMQVVERMSNDHLLLSVRIRDDGASGKKPGKKDVLYDFPDTRPLPLCDDDHACFELHMARPANRDRLRVLLYGHGLVRVFQSMDTPYQTTTSISRQILKRIIKLPSGEIDQDVYGYYWKCVYSGR